MTLSLEKKDKKTENVQSNTFVVIFTLIIINVMIINTV